MGAGLPVGHLRDHGAGAGADLGDRAGDRVAWPDGRIAPGVDADLALPGHDPATDVLALADVVRVMRAGEIQYEAAEQPRSAQRWRVIAGACCQLSCAPST